MKPNKYRNFSVNCAGLSFALLKNVSKSLAGRVGIVELGTLKLNECCQMVSLKNFIADNNLPFGILVNNSEETAMLADRIIQIPAGLL